MLEKLFSSNDGVSSMRVIVFIISMCCVLISLMTIVYLGIAIYYNKPYDFIGEVATMIGTMLVPALLGKAGQKFAETNKEKQ